MAYYISERPGTRHGQYRRTPMMQTELNPRSALVATPRRMAAMPRYVGRFYVVFESMLTSK